MKRMAYTALIITIVFQMLSIIPTNAADKDCVNYEKAVDLKILGLFLGNGKSFDLERTASRAEAANMLVRLLGKDQEAKDLKSKHPFTDVPAWADNQVGYMYKNGLTMGISKTLFGTARQLTAEQYATFVLRSLGYDEKNGDFQSGKALDKAVEVGLLTIAEADKLKSKSSFLRDDLAGISYNALNTKLKASGITLLDKLVNQDKAVSKVSAKLLGLYTSDLKEEIGNITDFTTIESSKGYVVKNSTELFKLLRKFFYENKTQFDIDFGSYAGDITGDFEAACNRAINAVTQNTGVENFLHAWRNEVEILNYKMKVTVEYRYSGNEFLKMKQWSADTVFKARHIIMDIIKYNMSDYNKELAMHDYIVSNTKYDNDNYLSKTIPQSSYSAYGSLILGTAVDEGYSRAMKLLCDLINMECYIVDGEKLTKERHKWNIVKIDGKHYHLDVAFDDLILGKDVSTYFHFNLPDSEMRLAYGWEAADYPQCISTESNYYYKMKLVVNNVTEFDDLVQKAIGQKKTRIEYKIKDYTKGDIPDISKIVFKSKKVSSFKYFFKDEFGIVRITEIKY